jgi:thiol-disulfide isomerase/thioredoxin
VENIPPEALAARISSQQGYLVVNLTSTDSKCRPCIGGNTKFAASAKAAPTGTWVQVAWTPWNQFPETLLPLLRKHGIQGIPARLVFDNGVLIDKVVGEPVNTGESAAQVVTGTLPVYAPTHIQQQLSTMKGLVVVQLTSFDASCSFCIKGNPVFEQWAASAAASARFVRVIYKPWTSVGQSDFAKALGVGGLPVFLTYRDGQLLRRVDGVATAEALQKQLLDGAP